MKQRGFTLIEMMVVFVMISVVGLTIFNVAMGAGSNSTISWGVNGVTESRCIEGYKFVIGDGGQPRQILDEFGKGVRCESGLR